MNDARHLISLIELAALLFLPAVALVMGCLCFLPRKVFVAVFLLVAGTSILLGVSL
jgi:putative effector of murein hydrolase LrgA (UPF0299 family)